MNNTQRILAFWLICIPLRVFFVVLSKYLVDNQEEEWLKVGSWVYENFDLMSGVSFLPYSEHTYKQAPYQDCNVDEYEELKKKMPTEVDWSKLSDYENSDQTVGSQELACVAGNCEIQ